VAGLLSRNLPNPSKALILAAEKECQGKPSRRKLEEKGTLGTLAFTYSRTVMLQVPAYEPQRLKLRRSPPAMKEQTQSIIPSSKINDDIQDPCAVRTFIKNNEDTVSLL
jgi:hypothetical protein